MFEFHHDRYRYFEIQVTNTRESVIPFIEQYVSFNEPMRILEIGCGEGGVLKAFIDRGHTGVGVELEQARALHGRAWMANEVASGQMKFIVKNIFDVTEEELGGKFHLVNLKDVIEHLPDKPLFFERIKTMLYPGGIVFFGFPPWQMPFGGHQQMCNNRWLACLPWIHLLPRTLYTRILRYHKESVDDLLDIRNTRINIEGFERLVRKQGYKVVGKKHFLIAPIYQYKFNIRQRAQLPLLRNIPYLRNFCTTQVYYLVKLKEV